MTLKLMAAGILAGTLLVCFQQVKSHPPDPAPSPYRVENITLPEGMVAEVSGVAFSPSGQLVICNRPGEIWFGNPDGTGWRRFADGLHEPLGLLVDSDSRLYVLQRPELTRVEDSNGDGRADRFETVADDWGLTDNYHEFAYGLKRDAAGFFLGGLGLDSVGEIDRSRGPLKMDPILRERQRSLSRFRGWVFKVSPQGEFLPWAMGFRQPNGIGLSPEGDLFVTDNQGDWVASSGLIHVRQDHFYGHPASLKWAPHLLPEGPLSAANLSTIRTPPAVVLPHGPMGGSPGEPVWDTTSGRFGPFQGQVFLGDFSKLVSRIYLEKIGGEFQGACIPFLRDPEIEQGNIRMAFAPDGSLYIAQTTRGWAKGEGLRRVVWSGADPVEIHSMALTSQGFRLTFTVPMAGLDDASAFEMTRFRYFYHSEYGSRPIEMESLSVKQSRPSEDGRSVDLELHDLRPGFIYQLEAPRLRSRTGSPLRHSSAYYTANRTIKGEFASVSVPSDVEGSGEAREAVGDVATGENVYKRFCLACHQADGRGVPGLQTPDFTSSQGPLNRTDALLVATIAKGKEEKGMPPFGSTLNDKELWSVVAYLKAHFGGRSQP